MKATTLLYSALAVVGLAVAVAVPVAVHRAGSDGVPLWAAAASPGPLSAAHEFLGARCESCHVPTRGVEAASCLTCHATAAPDLVTKPSTAFHASIGECGGCHVEHQGRGRRPVNMDHTVLVGTGHARVAEASARDARAGGEGIEHTLARLRELLGGSVADLGGSTPWPRDLPAGEANRLDCVGCHANRDPHRTLFGRDCQGCHTTAAWSVGGFRHPSPRSRDCAQCHQAPPSHYMMHFEMMDRTITGQEHASVDQCFLCHQTDAWTNIRGVGWYKHH
ncbi:class III cytochrome C family protein [Dankookia rubra]|uniref:Class III cytochrome C family protein n=1 Tax=Dankookia rubra TaxID=1442381 RepID=A0A4R5QHK6_9PROT|nr:cytochrome c3 family protein [Dankookia rubra]TDH62111.1 class III cytochrome C family protein [Dankookia rubra]